MYATSNDKKQELIGIIYSSCSCTAEQLNDKKTRAEEIILFWSPRDVTENPYDHAKLQWMNRCLPINYRQRSRNKEDDRSLQVIAH